jgi:hypothetical protein
MLTVLSASTLLFSNNQRTMAKYYEVRDYSHRPGWVEYISESTTSLEDAWTTYLPLDPIERKKFDENNPTLPKRFSKRSEAIPYLDALKSARLADWRETGYYYKARGYNKPAWKIYAVDEQRNTHTGPELAS